MLDDLYQSDTDAAINDLIARPLPPKPQPTKFSAWKTLTAAPRGVGTGANETAGGIADVLGAFGQTMAATDARSGMFSTQTPEQRKQETQARRKMLDEGLEFNAGDDFREQARQWMPDPTTAHVAEQTVFGLTRFGTKAVAGAAVAGPVVGSGLVGLDEALTTADDLKRQGVDPLTRAQVGAVVGLTSALGVALPVAGNTATQTAALVAVGGPLSFMGQQAATREILQAADYTQLADQYDPLDPVGLAVSTIIPAGFGAFALRGARARAAEKAKPLAPDVAAPEQVAATPERARPTPEQVDAARVEMLTQHVESTRLTPAEDFSGARAHSEALTRAMDQLAAGERVEVADVAPPPRVAATETPEFKAWFGDSRAVTEEGRPQVLYHGTADSFDSFSMSRAGENGQNFGRMIFLTSDAKVASGYSVDLRKSPDHLAAVQREDELSRAYAQSFLAEGKASENTQRLKREYDQAVADRRALDSRINTFQEPTEGANVVPVYASLRNPLEVDAGGRFFFDVHEDAINRAQSGGHDGVIIRNVIDSATTETRAVADVFVAFRPEQVKSAIGNSGRFDPASASLTDSPFDTWAKRVIAAAEESRTTTEATANARAMDQIARGERVEVADVAPVPRVGNLAEFMAFKTGASVSDVSTDLVFGTGTSMVARFRDAAVQLSVRDDADGIYVVNIQSKSPDDIAAQVRGTGKGRQVVEALREYADSTGKPLFVAGVTDGGDKFWRSISWMRPENVKLEMGSAVQDGPGYVYTPKTMQTTSFASWSDQINSAITDTRAAAKQEPAPNVKDAPQARADAPADGARQPEPAAQPARADAPSAGPAGAAEQGGGGVSAARGGAAEARLVEQRLAEVQQQFPDLTVQMDGMDKPMPLADFLAEVQREAMDGTDFELGGNDAPLMQIAATCFLLNG